MKNLTGLLTPIADTLQLQLHYQSRSGKVMGHRQIPVELTNGVTIPVDVMLEASYLHPSSGQSAVMCKLGGSLHLLMCYAEYSDTLSAHVLDARKFGGGQNTLRKLMNSSRDLKMMTGALRHGVAASYIKKPLRQWKQFFLPKG